mmetsp:Transcript_18128/g.37737  ORF Transcript_18128/g.37737 Transcript_18128/m.37737 type:complete len:488 (+) Transcript_18128:1594-3057(+)
MNRKSCGDEIVERPRLHRRRWGQGTSDSVCYVLLHGFMGTCDDWAEVTKQITDAQAGSHCLAVDLPYHGGSVGIDCDGWQEMRRLVMECIEEELLVGEDFVMIGYSFGGRLALQLAQIDCEIMKSQLRGVMLISAHPGLESEDERRLREMVDLRRAAELDACQTNRAAFRCFVERWYSTSLWGSLPLDARFAHLVDRRVACNDAQRLGQFLIVMDASTYGTSWEWLKKRASSLPILFICGVEDQEYVNIGDRLEQMEIPVVRCMSSGHNVVFQEPSLVVRVWRAFSWFCSIQRTTFRVSKVEVSKYSIPLTKSISVGPERVQYRRGLILRLSSECGGVSYGEIAPLPGLHQETLEHCLSQIDIFLHLTSTFEIPGPEYRLTQDRLARWFERLAGSPLAPSVRLGLEMASLGLLFQRCGTESPVVMLGALCQTFDVSPVNVSLNGVVPRIDGDLKLSVQSAIDQGFRVLKLKVGCGREMSLIEYLAFD